MSETCNILLAGKKFLCEIVMFSRNITVIENWSEIFAYLSNFRPRFVLISLKKAHHLKLLPANALFLLKIQKSLEKKRKVITSNQSPISYFSFKIHGIL